MKNVKRIKSKNTSWISNLGFNTFLNTKVEVLPDKAYIYVNKNQDKLSDRKKRGDLLRTLGRSAKGMFSATP